jgi:hypothetical protein
MATPDSTNFDRKTPKGPLARDSYFKQGEQRSGVLILKHPVYKQHVAIFGQDRETVARGAVLDHEFSPASEESGEYDSLLRVGNLKQIIWRGISGRALRSGVDLGLAPYEKVLVQGGLEVAPLTDRIYFGWREHMVKSDLAKWFREIGHEEAADWLAKKDATNPYSVVVADGDLIRQVPYADAFPKEYRALNRALSKLARNLNEFGDLPETKALVTYFESYRKASMETDLGILEERWKQVDMDWMDVQTPIQPIHAMETINDPAKLRVDPEFRLVMPDENAAVLTSKGQVSLQRLHRDISERFSGYETYRASQGAIANSSVMATTTLVLSGRNLDTRATGQIVPNRTEVKIAKGVKIFLDPASMEVRSAGIKKLLDVVFGAGFAEKEYVDPDFIISGSMGTVGHEAFHPAFVTPETEERLGKASYSLMEETKADLGGIAMLPEQVRRGELTTQELRWMLTYITSKGLRYLRFSGNPSLRPYYNIALTEINMLLGSGVLQHTGDGWEMNYSERAVDGFFLRANKALTEFADVYESYDKTGAQSLAGKYFRETPEILDLVTLIKSVN